VKSLGTRRRLAGRWDLWLPLAALLAAFAFAALGVTAERALRESRELAREGAALRLAHEVERELREAGPEAAPEVLGQALRDHPGLAAGLVLLGAPGDPEVAVGSAGVETLDLELFLGREWAGGGPGRFPGPFAGRFPPAGGHGRRTLRVSLHPDRPPPVERAVAPAAVAAGGVLVGLALLGGRLLTRQREEQARESTRRRLEGLGRAGAGLAHQLRNPLATVKGSAQLLLERAGPDGAKPPPDETTEKIAEKRLRSILEQTLRMERLIGRLLDYARPPRAEAADVPLGAALRELAERGDRPRVRLRKAPDAVVRVDPEHLRQILDNLLDNALSASPPEAEVEVSAAARNGRLEIEVADRGPGPGDDPEHLFEPYVTTRAEGTGLGLPIARALAEANGGALALRPRPGGGSVATLSLPRGAA
jgi:two-component system, NtrC family, sensor histidine kinase HydH